MLATEANAESIVVAASGRSTVADAIAWIGDGNPLSRDTEPRGHVRVLDAETIQRRCGWGRSS